MPRRWTRKHTKGYRSGLEDRIAKELEEQRVKARYEPYKMEYVQPEKNRKYTPDFVLPNKIHIETKGLFTAEDRQKHLWIRDCNPKVDLRFVFQNPRQKIRKGSKTSYADWCDKNNFKWAASSIPKEWIDE